MIEVEEHDGQFLLITAGAAAQDPEFLVHGPPVGDAGQGVDPSVGAQAVVELDDPARRDELALERRGVQRLDEQVIGAGLHGLARGLLIGLAGEHDHIGVAVGRAPANPLRERRAVEAGHAPVGDEHRRALALEDLHRLAAVVGHRADVAEALDRGPHDKARNRVIVGDEDVERNEGIHH